MILPEPPTLTVQPATDGPSQHSALPLRNAVAKSASEKKHLRLYTEQPPKPARPADRGRRVPAGFAQGVSGRHRLAVAV